MQMAENGEGDTGTELLTRLLLISGFLMIVVGAFVAFLFNVWVGLIVVAAGLFDLGFAVFLPKIRKWQD